MTFLKKVHAALTPENMKKAIALLDSDAEYQSIMSDLKANAIENFNTYYKKSDDEVKKAELKEESLVQKANARAAELGLKKQNGFYYLEASVSVLAETNFDKFMAVYEEGLKDAVKNKPNDYAYGLDKVPEVLKRMSDAIKKGSYNHDGHAFKYAAKKLGLKHTRKAIEEFLGLRK